MSEIITKYLHEEVDRSDGYLCKYSDVEPLIKRNAELETENQVQRLQIDHLEAEITRLREQLDLMKGKTMSNTRTPSATVKFYDMPDGTVETEVDMHGGYAGTEAQKIALRHDFHFPVAKQWSMPCANLDGLLP